MNEIARRLTRLEKAAARPAAAEVPVPVLTQKDEQVALAQKLAQCFRDRVEGYKQTYGLTSEEAVAKATALPPGVVNSTRRVPPDAVSWGDLTTLFLSDPAVALEKWMETREAAREELQGGARAAGAVQAVSTTPWSLAQFLAVRDKLIAEWHPEHACEFLLIDQAAQAYTLVTYWQEEVTARTAHWDVGGRGARPAEKLLDDWLALDESMRMYERWHTIYVRTLKALRDMRRGRPRHVVGLPW
jgi:hypothetical protein